MMAIDKNGVESLTVLPAVMAQKCSSNVFTNPNLTQSKNSQSSNIQFAATTSPSVSLQ